MLGIKNINLKKFHLNEKTFNVKIKYKYLKQNALIVTAVQILLLMSFT